MKKKILSLLTAFAMVFGILVAPFTTAKAAEATTTKTVTLHKILMNKTTFGDFTQGTTGKDKTEYIGQKIEETNKPNSTEKSTIEGFFGTGAKEIDGVYFALKFAADYGTTAEEKAMAGKYVKASGTSETQKLIPESPLAATTDVKEAVGGLTQANNAGVVFTTAGLTGKFEIDEIHDMSTYKGADGETLTDMKAVPTKITLPLVNDEGIVEDAHVYPKNTEEKPDTHKDFTKEFTTEQPNGRDENAKSNATPEKHNVGDVIDYTVTTKVPAKTKWKTAFWDDKMTEGLTFVTREEAKKATKETDKLYQKGLTVKYDGKEMDATWYELSETENGFTLKLNDTGLAEIAKATEDKIIRLDYHAVLNEKAVVKIPESNDVTFHYGNNKDHGNTPVPNKPNDDGNLTVTKTWDGNVKEKSKKAVTFTLYNAQTGKQATIEDLVEPSKKENETNKDYEKRLADFNAYKDNTGDYANNKGFQSVVTIENSASMTHTWKYLNKNIEYKVEETYDGFSVEYGKGDAGQLTAKNYEDNNPKPINPNEPKVVTGGAKFVKTNVDGTERLAGAKFVVKNDKNELLTKEGTSEADRTAYTTAQTAFETAVKAYNDKVKGGKVISSDNKVTIGNVEYSDDAKAKAAIAKIEKARDDAWNATLKNMTKWDASATLPKNETEVKNTKLLVLTSNDLGQFEIAGLAPGTYKLVEVLPPKDYANNFNEFEFTIGDDNLQETKDIDFGTKDAKNAQQVKNKKVSIPETGGIGSLIFIVAGAAIMIGAFVAYKKSQAVEA